MVGGKRSNDLLVWVASQGGGTMSLYCYVGWHAWEQNRDLHIRDMHPGLDSFWSTPTRKCIYCGTRQKWLPGYGGSELGCWCPDKEK